MKIDYSLIVPVYNETTRVFDGLSEIFRYFSQEKDSYELLLVDDGSNPSVESLISKNVKVEKQCSSLMKKGRFRIIRIPQNKGKGKAIAYGVKRALGEVILFTDIDCSVPLAVIPRFRKALLRSDIAIASRRLEASKIMVHQPWVRESAGRIYTFLSNLICETGVSDATCGMKAFRARVAKRLFSQGTVDRWAFDTEILFLARKYGMSIEEIPVSWFNKAGSKVKPKDTLNAFFDIVSIRWRDWQGEYDD